MKTFFLKCWKFFLFSFSGHITGDPKHELKIFGARIVVMLSVAFTGILLMVAFLVVSWLAMQLTKL